MYIFLWAQYDQRGDRSACVLLKEDLVLVSKWGNSLAVRLPKNLVEQMKIKEGDDVDIVENGDGSFRLEKKMTRKDALNNLFNMNVCMPKGYVFDREKENDRELYRHECNS